MVGKRNDAGITGPDARPKRWLSGGIAAVAVVAFIYAACLYCGAELRQHRRLVEAKLVSIADSKLKQIVSWRAERLDDGKFFSRALFAAQDIEDFLEEPQSVETKTRITTWLGQLGNGHRYSQAIIFDSAQQARFAIPELIAEPGPKLLANIKEALKTKGVWISDPFRERETSDVHLDVIIPIRPPKQHADQDALPIATLVFRVDLKQFLFPLLRTWPEPTESGEAALARREGNRVRFLSDVRFRTNSALNLTVPVQSAELPVAAAARGSEGVLEGRDYRGVPVITVFRPVPGTDWLLGVKVDYAEALAPLQKETVEVATSGVAFALAVLGGLGWFWRQRNFRFLQSQLLAERERRSLAERFELLMKNAGDAILLTDEHGKVLEANKRASEMYGFPPADWLQLRMTDLCPGTSGCLCDSATQNAPGENEGIFEGSHRRKDGTSLQVEMRSRTIELGGSPCRLYIIRDSTQRKEVEEKLRRVTHRLLLATRSARMGIWELDLQKDQLEWDEEMFRLYGISREQFGGTYEAWKTFLHPEDRTRLLASVQDALSGIKDYNEEFRVVWPDSSVHYIQANGAVERDPEGRPIRMIGTNWDITERKAAEDALRQRLSLQNQLTQIAGIVPGAIYSFRLSSDGSMSFPFASPALEKIFGVSPEQVQNDVTVAFAKIHPADVQHVQESILQSARSLSPWRTEFRVCGTPVGDIWAEGHSIPQSEADGSVLWHGFLHDITDRKKAEEELRKLSRAVEQSCASVVITSPTGEIEYVNRKFTELTGYSLEEVRGKNPRILKSGETPPEIYQEMWTTIRKHGEWRGEFHNRKKNGELFWEFAVISAIFDGAGQITHFLAIKEDITERKKAEEQLRLSEHRFRELAETIQDVFWIVEPGSLRVLYISPAYEVVWGRSCESLYAQPQAWLEAVHIEDQDRVRQAADEELHHGTYEQEYRVVRPDGGIRWVQSRSYPVFDATGKIDHIIGISRDITQTRQLEQQLNQAQRLEAIGQLAGGVAHDFNNLLAVILIQAELAALTEGLPTDTREGLVEIHRTAERAASLTRQLLLFSRRQVLQAQDLDLNQVVTDLAKMLRRVLREDIRLELNLDTKPLWTHADAGMLDQVLLNLSVNARDAMPNGGKLSIVSAEKILSPDESSRNPEAYPGRFVWLSVSDTGTGIPADVLPRIFEPFFTTKEPGKGTGLGLATVFGIVKQHKGWIEVSTEPGKGTSFHIYLPARERVLTDLLPTVVKPKPQGGTETILLVEDEPSVRTVMRGILSRSGYEVLEAGHGPDALALARQHPSRIHLLLTDLVMPEGIDGRELARRLQIERPNLRIIFMTGYSRELAGRELALEPGQGFIQKPCTSEHLLESVHNCLRN